MGCVEALAAEAHALGVAHLAGRLSAATGRGKGGAQDADRAALQVEEPEPARPSDRAVGHADEAGARADGDAARGARPSRGRGAAFRDEADEVAGDGEDLNSGLHRISDAAFLK